MTPTIGTARRILRYLRNREHTLIGEADRQKLISGIEEYILMCDITYQNGTDNAAPEQYQPDTTRTVASDATVK